VAFDLQGLLKSSILARSSGARRVVGFPIRHLRERWAHLFYTETIEPPTGVHVVDKNLALLAAVGLRDLPKRFPLQVGAAANRPVSGVRCPASTSDGGQEPGAWSLEPGTKDQGPGVRDQGSGIGGATSDVGPRTLRTRDQGSGIGGATSDLGSRGSTSSPRPEPVEGRTSDDAFALINPGAGWPNKRWPPEWFGVIADRLRANHGLASVVLWGPGEEALARTVVESSRGAARLAPPTGIGDMIVLARAASLLVSGDTGPLHIAAAVGTPIVGIYGPTSPARNGPWNPADLCVSRFDACHCHHRRRCRLPVCCLLDISVEEVCAAIDRRLAADPSRHA
jgi:ADP-heptose:LPS heptosyltransferase